MRGMLSFQVQVVGRQPLVGLTLRYPAAIGCEGGWCGIEIAPARPHVHDCEQHDSESQRNGSPVKGALQWLLASPSACAPADSTFHA